METGYPAAMFMGMRLLVPLAIVLCLTGCTPMAYQKAGVTQQQASVDEMDCRSMAAREAWPMWAWPRPYGRRRYPYFGDPLLNRMQEESSLSDFCMRARGYNLQPVPNPS